MSGDRWATIQVQCSACERVHVFPGRFVGEPQATGNRRAVAEWCDFHTWHHTHAGEDVTLTPLEHRVEGARLIREAELDVARAFVEGLREGKRRAAAELRRFVGREAGKGGG